MKFTGFSTHTLLFRTVMVTISVLILLTNVAAAFPSSNSFFGVFFQKLLGLFFGHQGIVRSAPTYSTAPVDSTNIWDPAGSPQPPKP